jgi:hypothetical protein
MERDEACFDALVHRYGPMVFGVCRRVLHSHHDAEDAFQATFLVLVRKASSLRRREAVASWLYGVAYRTALEDAIDTPPGNRAPFSPCQGFDAGAVLGGFGLRGCKAGQIAITRPAWSAFAL